MNRATKEDCLEAINKLVLGEHVENVTYRRINPEMDVCYLAFRPEYLRPIATLSCTISLHEAYGHVHCNIDAGAIRIVCNPNLLQAAYDHVKSWLFRK